MAKRGRKPKFLGVQCPNKRCRKRPPQVVANGRYQTRDGPVRQFLCRACGQGFLGGPEEQEHGKARAEVQPGGEENREPEAASTHPSPVLS